MKNRSLALGMMVLALSLFATGCAGKAASIAGLPDKGLAMIAKMDELASSEAYVSAMSASSELGDLIAAMGAGDYTAPAAIYSVSVPEDAVQKLMFGDEGANLPDELIAWMQAKACAAIPTQMAGRSGASMLAAVSCVTYGQALLCEGLSAPVLYLYQYNGDYSAMAAFTPGLDGAVSGSACFVPADEELRGARSAQAVAEWISNALGYMQVTAVKVS